jgi:hypothetical protein
VRRIIINRLAAIVLATLVPLAFVTVVSPGMSYATECGEDTEWDEDSDTCVGTGPDCGDGTEFDLESNSCWAEVPDPPDPPEPPDLSPVLDNFSVDFCLPGAFSLCLGL